MSKRRMRQSAALSAALGGAVAFGFNEGRARASAPIPLYSWNFDASSGTGSTVANGGTGAGGSLTLATGGNPGTPTDLFGASGTGHTGAVNDYNFNNTASVYNNSSTSGIAYGATSSLANTSSFTITMWLKIPSSITAVTSGGPRILDLGYYNGWDVNQSGNPPIAGGIGVQFTGDGGTGGYINPALINTQNTASNNIPVHILGLGNTWHFIAMTYNGSSSSTTNTFSMYDGTNSTIASQVYNGSFSSGGAIDALDLALGNRASGDRGFAAAYDDVRLYNSTLTLSQLQVAQGFIPPGVAATWEVSASGDWNSVTNWDNGFVPNAIGQEADLSNAVSATTTVFSDSAISLGTLNFNNSNTYEVTGNGSLTLQTSTGSAQVIVQAGIQKIDLPLALASNTNFNVSSGQTLKVSNPLTINSGVSLVPTNTGTVTYESTISLLNGAGITFGNSTYAHSLSLAANATATLAPHNTSGSKTVLQLDSLTLDPAATVNVGNNDLLVHGATLSTIFNQLKTGFAGGAWNGHGISSSSANANTAHLTALGYVQASGTQTVDGQSLIAGDVLVKYTYYGDATLDGKVDGTDYSRIDSAYLAGGMSGWNNGDFNYDGSINGTDYTLIDNAFNSQGAQITASVSVTSEIASPVTTSAVPEPGSLCLLIGGSLALLGRRRSKAV